MMRAILTAAALMGVSSYSAADDVVLTPSAEPQVQEKCFSAKGLVKFYDKMSSLKPARMDTLEAIMSAKFTREDEAKVFPKFWARNEGVDTPFEVNADGHVVQFHQQLQTLPETAELCGEKLSKEGEEAKAAMSIETDVIFKNRTGPYSLAELQDGVADGKSLYKKMMPGPVALLVPKMSHVTLQSLDISTPLSVSFLQAGNLVAKPPIERFGTAYVIALEDIEASGADTMTVGGGEFKLMPSPSVKKMKSLGFKADSEEEKPQDE